MRPGDPFGFPSSNDPFPTQPRSSAPGPSDWMNPGPQSNAPFDLTPSGPPLGVLYIAAAVAAVGIAVSVAAAIVLPGPVAAIGWMLCGPIAIGLLSYFVIVNTRRQADPGYGQEPWAPLLYGGVFILAMIGVIVGAVRLAFWAGRL